METTHLLPHWKLQSLQDLDRLIAAKRQVHQAAQLVASISRSLLPAHKGDLFGNLTWHAQEEMLLGWSVAERFGFRAAIRPRDLSFHLCTPAGQSVHSLALAGKTFEEALNWVTTVISHYGTDVSRIQTALPYSIPEYPQATGTHFDSADEEAFAEFACTLSNAHHAMRTLGTYLPLWQEIKVWPHHFDMYTRHGYLIDQQVSHMGIAYNVGDDHDYRQPYYNLSWSPNKDLDREHLPDLPAPLQWRTERWFGVILFWEDLMQEGSSEGQVAKVVDFFNQGMRILEEHVLGE